jgi:hypothetical protein
MLLTVHLFVMVLGLVLLLLAGLNVPSHPRLNLGWLGLFFCFLSLAIR